MKWALGLCVAPVACAPAPKPAFSPAQPFADADFARSAAQGTAAVSGQAFLKTVGGDVKSCAGNEVTLVADTTYTEEVRAAMTTSRYASVTYDPRYVHDRRTAICDAEGKFAFANLPAGKWFLSVAVQWGAPSGSGRDGV